jgi:RNA polymerase sigma-70 factor (ECF subfamily)
MEQSCSVTVQRLEELPRHSDMSDEELASRVLAGHTALFSVLMRRHNQQLYRSVRAILRDDDEAEDALQQAYLAVFRGLAGFDGRARLSTWMTRIAVNEALHGYRKRKRFREMQEELESSPPPQLHSPADAAIGRELVALVEEAIDQLPESYRLVLVLRDVQELSTREVAEIVGASVENVRVRLHRGRSLVRERLRARLGSSEPFAFAGHRCDRTVLAVMGALLGEAAASEAASIERRP